MRKNIELKLKKYNDDLYINHGVDGKFLAEGNWKTHLEYFLEYFHPHIKKDNLNITLLDVGCGAGLVSRELLKYGFKIYGVDFSSQAIELAKVENPEINFQYSSIYKLPFPNKKFDVIICLGVFQTVEYPEKALAEMARVLKKDGVLIVRTLNALSLSYLKAQKDNPDFVFYNPFSFRKKMSKAGFKVKAVKGIYSFPKKFNFLIEVIIKTKLYKILNFLFFPIFLFFSHGFYVEGIKK